MDVTGLWSLQCMMFLLTGAGAILKRKGVLKEAGKTVLTDAVLYFFLPCNIINSFRMKFDSKILLRFGAVLFLSVFVQIGSYILSRILYNKKPDSVKRVLQYATIVSNSGFLGLPIAEGIYGAEGMMYASIFIIPMRIMMWSAGIACFTESPDFKSVVKKIAFHPCIVAVYIGLFLLLFQVPIQILNANLMAHLPSVVHTITGILGLALDRAVRSAGSCTTALTMLLIGMMLSEVSFKSLFHRDALFISLMRLIILPFFTLALCRILKMENYLTAVCVLMTGMPAGSTSAILAAKYDCDYVFATKCVVISTLLSMLTIPFWSMGFS
ncbi:permease [Lacrimispora amygdalina]|uniref:AEC family transporter n=1 Tax=Lacrimispora amygdalina TaxID=253257 RepID=A0A3E2NA74_9FIRM|nr:AEC family transporter [Clostridium indicum]RFZ77907.1 AEC family transporter [Clostridium indicum]